MTPDARLSAAVEILHVIGEGRRPAAEALKDWGSSHRFAGSSDRAGVAGLVYDALRVRASSAWIMGEDTPRAILLGSLRQARGMEVASIAAACTGGAHAPDPLSPNEFERLSSPDPLAGAPDHVRGDYPAWLAESFAEAFGETAVDEGRALAARAPLDLRVNTLKSDRDKALRALSHLKPQPTPLSPWGLRIELNREGRGPVLSGEPSYAKGRVEVQDEGSQLAVLLSGARPGWQVLDLCAGGGGKTLALAAMMDNRGQIYAADSDARRLGASFERLERAGVRNVQVRPPRGEQDVLADIEGRCDLVLVDAPCTGTGAWRRNPDAKWRIRPGALEQRVAQQNLALAQAVRFVKPGGVLVYVTCSLLRAENEDRIAAFLSAQSDFLPLEAGRLAERAGLPALAQRASPWGPGLRLSPLTTGTDGFYIATLLRS